MIKTILRKIWGFIYHCTIAIFRPFNLALIQLRGGNMTPNSVLHISYMVHVPWHTTRILRSIGMQADYLANSTSLVWNRCDFQSPSSKIPVIQALLEFILFWRVVARYQAVHLHFAHTMSRSGWELPILKKMGRTIVIHYRGCEIRDYHKNMRLYPDMNICQDCDYDHCCVSEANKKRIGYVSSFGDVFLVTTPDLKDFVPEALHMPFFCPENISEFKTDKILRYPHRPLHVLHWTNHPGIEGTEHIKAVIESLKKKGYSLEFIFLKGVSYDTVIQEIPKADLVIGKMKMGYYANSQIEAMACGVPTITWVRPEFMTEELRNSGFIFSHLTELEQTLQYFLDNPDALEQKRDIARKSILRLHDNDKLAKQYKSIYEEFA